MEFMPFQVNDVEFRRIEAEVLDRFHTALPLYQRNRKEARLGLLNAFDSLALLTAMAVRAGADPDVSSRQVEKKYEDGLAQAMRWLTQDGEEPSVSSRVTLGLLNDAGNFLLHAADYSSVADFHRLYGANKLMAEVDLQNKRIRFRYTSRDRGFDAAMGYISSLNHELSRLNNENEIAGEINPQTPIRSSISNGMVRLQNPELLAVNDPTFRLPVPPKAITDDVDLGGFTMMEFRGFWKALSHWSAHCLGVFVQSVMNGMDQELCMPTQVIPTGVFYNTMGRLSGITQEKIARITARLAFDYRTKVPCIFQQPLLIGCGNVAWSPNLIIYSRFDRNMLRLMARTPALKSIADGLIGGRERLMLNSFGQYLQQRSGWSYKLNQKVHHGTRNGEIDFLGYSPRESSTVIVMEWKSILTADEINEVRAATAQLVLAQDQVLNSIKILESMSIKDKKITYPFVDWNKVSEYIPLVVTQDVEPDETYSHTKVPCLCVDSLDSFGKRRDSSTPTRLVEFARSRPWHRKYDHLQEEFREIGVGEFVYEVPMLIEPLKEYFTG